MKNQPETSFSKRQHIVPQFILKNFSPSSAHQIYVYDKKEDNVFLANIEKVAKEKNFYNIDYENSSLSFEPSLSYLESKAKIVIDKIIESESLLSIDDEEKWLLSTFFAIQLVRGNQARTMIKDIHASGEEKLKRFNADPSIEKIFKSLTENKIKEIIFRQLDDPSTHASYIFDKMWLLHKTSEENPLYISENPVVMNNTVNINPFYNNIGLAIKGIEIYFPISKTLILGIYCKSHEEMIRDTYHKYCEIIKVNPDFKNKPENIVLFDLIEGIDFRNAILSEDENVMYYNSLQVSYASRFIFSSTDNFDLAKKMIAQNPRLKEGRRIKVD